MEKKLVVCIMGQNCEKFIGMCLDSVKTADAIVYCDGGSTDGTLDYIKNQGLQYLFKIKIIENEYNQEDKGMNGKQRNFYLNYLKEHYKDDWCLCLDADEVLEDYGIQKLKSIIIQLKDDPITIFSPRIHHFIGDLGHEDCTRDIHYVPNRFFKITDDLSYTEVEHSVLQGSIYQGTVDIHIWHLRECQGIFETNRKYNWNRKKSNMHSKTQLKQWQRDMLFGNYPRKRVHYDQIPTPIKHRFDI